MMASVREAVPAQDSNSARWAAYQGRLLALARSSIRSGLLTGRPIQVNLEALEGAMREKAATFVSLKEEGQLRGCVGTLTPVESLAESVARNAYQAAFADSRFEAVEPRELDRLHIEISILGPMEPLRVGSYEELVESLRPGVDGLFLDDGLRRATFLPSVWESLPRPSEFVAHLLRKGGWPSHHWSPEMRAFTYRVHTLAEHER